ncbi:hypothetical protein HDK90DRAFT_493797 [Phyllosticta capitalensis]|uniref:Telomeric single stranded DNA binding POT1/Cdc13 domain-containing protein n=1 Tax=Phyllosticta capitalensis TaxID=121624 RepID=A0ABR1YHN6_9PEZI
MAFNTTAASNTPDLKRLPISALHPGLPSLATQSIVAIITLVWPYSSSTRACALLLAEPDFRLRRRRGQVRVQFFADAAEAVATSGVGIGDVVVLRLGPAVQWLQSSGEEEVVRTPGKSVEWELGYRRALRLRAWRDGEVLASLDVRGEQTPDRQIEEAEEEVYNTPSKIVGRFSGEGLKMGSWASPAFLKRSRLSLESRRDSSDLFADEDGYVEGKGRKKRKSWMNVGKWTYANRTPSPEKGEAESVEDMSPTSQMDGIASQAADGLNTPESSKTPIEVDENDELVPERPPSHGDEGSTTVDLPRETLPGLFLQPKPAAAGSPPKSFHGHEPAAEHAEAVSPSPALPEETELSREEAVDQQFLSETHKPDFVEGDTEENTEVDEFPSEPEDRLEGQLSLKQLRAIEEDESATEEDDPPLLVPGAVPQTQLGVESSDEEEDSDNGMLQVTELDRSLTPTEVDSEEEEEPENELEEGVETQAAKGPVETARMVPKEGPAESPQRGEQMSSFEPTSQAGATQTMPPPLVRPMGFDEPLTSTATRTPPRTPRSSAVGAERAPPTPQLPPVSSKNLPLPSPFPGTSAQEPTSYMDARPLPEAQKTEEHQRLPVVEEEQDPKELQLQSSVVSDLPPIDSQDFVDGGLGPREFPESAEPFPFGLDGSVLSRFGKPQALDTPDEAPTALATETGKQDALQSAPAAPSATTLEFPAHSSPTDRETRLDVIMQDEPEQSLHQPQHMLEPVEKIDLSQDEIPKGSQPPNEQPVNLNNDLPSLTSDSVPKVQDKALPANEDQVFQGTADQYEPPSLSFDDYVPMVDDWEMPPNLGSDPVDEPAPLYDQESFGPPPEDYREMSPIPHHVATSPRPNDNHVVEKLPVESPPKSSKPEVTIIDLDSDTEEDESDAETAVPAKETTPVPVLGGKTQVESSLETPAKPGELEATQQGPTPQKPSSQSLSPAKRPQRGKTPFSDIDTLSQIGSTPRRSRAVPPASQASSIADRVSNRRRRKEIKDLECEWDSTATVSTQRPSSPPSEADPKPLEDNERYSTPTTTQVLEELSQQPLQVPAQRSSPPAVEEARRQNWEHERYSSPFTSQLLEDLSQRPIEELSKRPSRAQTELSPQKPPVTTIESLELPEVEQSFRAQSEASEKTPQQRKIQRSSPPAQQSSRAQSELSQLAGTSSPARENFRDMVRNFVRSSSPLPEHVQPSPKKQAAHSSMLIDDPSMMRALQTSQAPYSTQFENRMTSSPPREDDIPAFDTTQMQDDETQKRPSEPVRSPSAASTVRPVVERSSPVAQEATAMAAPSVETRQDVDVPMEGGLADSTQESEAMAEAAASIHSAQRPAQESLLTPDPSQQTAYVPSSIPGTHMEQTLPPSPRLTQISHAAEEIDLTQVKAKTQDLKITEPASPHEEHVDTTMGDTTLVEPLHRVLSPSPSFSFRSVEDAKSPSPTFSERVRLYESSQADLSQRSTFAQSQGTRTSLGYFTPLSSVFHHVNSQAQIDVLAVCTRATKAPERAKSGPKDYFTSFRIADESLDLGANGDDGSQPMTILVQVFRPWKAALPECDVGDAVLLRNFKPTSRKGKVGLLSSDDSAWCVFRYGKGSSQTQKNCDVNGEVVDLPYDKTKGEEEKDEGKENDKSSNKRRSNIMDSLRPIWADTMSGLWGDLTGLVEGMDDDTPANDTTDTQANGTNAQSKGKAKDQVAADLDHGKYNPESGAAREECHGPPVEYGDQERREARRLREWWVGGSGGGAAAV